MTQVIESIEKKVFCSFFLLFCSDLFLAALTQQNFTQKEGPKKKQQQHDSNAAYTILAVFARMIMCNNHP